MVDPGKFSPYRAYRVGCVKGTAKGLLVAGAIAGILWANANFQKTIQKYCTLDTICDSSRYVAEAVAPEPIYRSSPEDKVRIATLERVLRETQQEAERANSLNQQYLKENRALADKLATGLGEPTVSTEYFPPGSGIESDEVILTLGGGQALMTRDRLYILQADPTERYLNTLNAWGSKGCTDNPAYLSAAEELREAILLLNPDADLPEAKHCE